MRYISTFRQQLPKDLILRSVGQLVRYLCSNVPVVNTYACHAIERILTIKSGKDNLLTSADFDPFLPHILTNTLAILQPTSTSPATGENEYAMKCLMRLCRSLQEKVTPYLDTVLATLNALLGVVSKNPSKPNFNHYLFETLGVLVKAVCASDRTRIATFEAHLFPVFNYVLEQDITEFIPYAFQLLSLMLELQAAASVPAVYFELFPFLLMPALWERPGYIPALTRLLQAYIEKAAGACVAEKILGVLGVFQRLIASKSNDHYAFYILSSLTEHMAPEVWGQYVRQVFVLMFQRLTSSKTTKLVKSMLVFFALYAHKYGCANLMELIEGMQNG